MACEGCWIEAVLAVRSAKGMACCRLACSSAISIIVDSLVDVALDVDHLVLLFVDCVALLLGRHLRLHHSVAQISLIFGRPPA